MPSTFTSIHTHSNQLNMIKCNQTFQTFWFQFLDVKCMCYLSKLLVSFLWRYLVKGIEMLMLLL